LTFWGIEIGYGNSPDETYSITQIGTYNQLKSYKIKLEKNLMLNRVSDLHIGFGYATEEYGATNQYRNRYTIELGYKYRLK
jgi:hypothetical protein